MSSVDCQEADEEKRCIPPFASWAQRLKENRSLPVPTPPPNVWANTGANAWAIQREELRRSIIHAASEYTTFLEGVAHGCRIPSPPVPSWLSNEGLPPSDSASDWEIIMTGHQPTIFHPGIIEKVERLSAFVEADSQSPKLARRVGILVLMDTDSGDAGAFSVPCRESGGWSLLTQSLARGEKLFMHQAVIDSNEVMNVFERARQAVRSANLPSVEKRLDEVSRRYQSLGGDGMVVANSVVRRSFGWGSHCLELPISMLCELPTVQAFFQALIRDAKNFHAVYNETLHDFRQEHGIKNGANPFPDLKQDHGLLELPFWVIDHTTKTRKPLMVDPTQTEISLFEPTPETSRVKSIIAPRGMMITVLLRLLASDLFIHGTGGARYDACTDQWIKRYFNAAPPAFVVATATRRLLNQPWLQAKSQIAFQQQFRDMVSHPERWMESFSTETRELLEPLLAQRRTALEQLKAAKQSGQPAGSFGQQIAQIDRQVKQILTDEFQESLTAAQSISKQELEILKKRDFPYFLDSP